MSARVLSIVTQKKKKVHFYFQVWNLKKPCSGLLKKGVVGVVVIVVAMAAMNTRASVVVGIALVHLVPLII